MIDIRDSIPSHIVDLCRKASGSNMGSIVDLGRRREQALAALVEWVAKAPEAQRTTGPSITMVGEERSCQPVDEFCTSKLHTSGLVIRCGMPPRHGGLHQYGLRAWTDAEAAQQAAAPQEILNSVVKASRVAVSDAIADINSVAAKLDAENSRAAAPQEQPDFTSLCEKFRYRFGLPREVFVGVRRHWYDQLDADHLSEWLLELESNIASAVKAKDEQCNAINEARAAAVKRADDLELQLAMELRRADSAEENGGCKMSLEQKELTVSRLAVETAIDFELRACAARIIGLNGSVTKELFLKRYGLAFAAAWKAIPKLLEKRERVAKEGAK